MDSVQPDPSDRDLLALAAGGDRSAFDRFVLRHWEAVHRYARGLVHDETDAEEVLQRTFVQAWSGCANARVESGARAWLFTIARHALGRLRRPTCGARDLVSLEELGGAAGFAAPDATPERFAIATEERHVLEDALRQLPQIDREILILRDLEQLSSAEAAHVMDLRVEAVKSRLHRARLRLLAEVRQRLPQGESR